MRNGNWIASLAVAASCVAGCEDADYQSYNEAPLSEAAAHNHAHDHDHDHGEVGKYGGYVLELDDAHAHHGELVFDADTRDVTVYFYGSEVGVAKVASQVTLELHVADGHKELVAKSSPLEGETDETASCWVFSGTDLPANVTSEEQLDGHLEATIDGKPFSYGLEQHSHGDHDEAAHEEHSDANHAHDDHAHEEAKAK